MAPTYVHHLVEIQLQLFVDSYIFCFSVMRVQTFVQTMLSADDHLSAAVLRASVVYNMNTICDSFFFFVGFSSSTVNLYIYFFWCL